MVVKQFRNIAILKGGISSEREISLASGSAVATGLIQAGYQVLEIDVVSTEFTLPPEIDAVFIALHGGFGEDGGVQSQLNKMGVPYTGSNPQSSLLSYDKRLSKKLFDASNIPTPTYEILRKGQPRTLSLPVVLKPPAQGSTIGISRIFSESAWLASIEEAFQNQDEILVEEYIPGKELTVAIVCDEVLPIIEIQAPDNYYDFDAKYKGTDTKYIVPAVLEKEQTNCLKDLALDVYKVLGCRSLARVDIRLSNEGEPFVLELNSIPGFTQTSLLPLAAKAAGISFSDLCKCILHTATVE